MNEACRDDHLPHIAKLIVKNQGGRIVGPAGTGKTKLIELVAAEIQREHPTDIIVTMAFTHRASRIAGGKTIAHCLHRYKNLQNAWAIVDEFSQITLDLLRQISRWVLVGWKFIFVGDPMGQLLPFADRWGDAPIQYLNDSDLMRKLSEDLVIYMDTYRRGDDPYLFQFYTSLPIADESVETLKYWVSEATEKYPYDDNDIDYAIFLSDRKRRNWNIYMNRQQATCILIRANGPRCQFVECEKDEFGNPKDIRGSTAKQYDMILWIGMLLVGCSRKTKGPILKQLYLCS